MVKKVKNKKMDRLNCLIIIGMMIIMMIIPVVSAGVGIKWDRESVLIDEKERTCLNYNVYNPWPDETYVQIELSDELKDILTLQEVETKLIPANTASSESIPVEFCFEAPVVYEKDCWLAGRFICEQECLEEQKVFEGEVIVRSVPPPADIAGSGGSVTSMAVSAPLRLKIKCNAYKRNFTLIYILLMVFSLIVLISLLYKKYRKPKIERDREKVRKLQMRIRKAGKGKQKK